MVGLGDLPLGDLPGVNFLSDAQAVSADGSVVVGGSSSGGTLEAFRWTEGGGMVGLGLLPGGLRAYPKTPAAFHVMMAHARWSIA